MLALVADRSLSVFDDRTFRPEDSLTRGAFARLLAQAFHLPDATPLTLESPDEPISRLEAAIVGARALRLAGMQVQPALLTFTYAQAIPLYALADLKLAAAAGLYAGFPDGSFRPGQHLTRAEAATIVRRAHALMHP